MKIAKLAFNILAIIACVVAIYFSLTLKEMFVGQQQTRFETIDTNVNVSANADSTEAEIVKQTEVLENAKLERDTAAAALESLQATGRTLANQVNELGTTIEGQKTEVERLNQTIAEVGTILKEFGDDVTIDSINQIIQALTARRDELAKKRDEMENLTATAERNLAEKRADSERIAQRNIRRSTRLALNATEAVINSVNHDWGFVMIGAGSNSGFTPQDTMIVQRDGRVIGRIRPSSIEPTQTIAEIDYDSLTPGVRLQPGDRVLLATPSAN